MNRRKLEALRASRRDSVTRQKSDADYVSYRRSKLEQFVPRLHKRSRGAKKKYI